MGKESPFFLLVKGEIGKSYGKNELPEILLFPFLNEEMLGEDSLSFHKNQRFNKIIKKNPYTQILFIPKLNRTRFNFGIRRLFSSLRASSSKESEYTINFIEEKKLIIKPIRINKT